MPVVPSPSPSFSSSLLVLPFCSSRQHNCGLLHLQFLLEPYFPQRLPAMDTAYAVFLDSGYILDFCVLLSHTYL